MHRVTLIKHSIEKDQHVAKIDAGEALRGDCLDVAKLGRRGHNPRPSGAASAAIRCGTLRPSRLLPLLDGIQQSDSPANEVEKPMGAPAAFGPLEQRI